MIYLLFGNEPFLVGNTRRKFEGVTCESVDAVYERIAQPSLLAAAEKERYTVTVDSLKELDTDGFRALLDLSADERILFVARNVDKRAKIYKALKSDDRVKFMEMNKPEDLRMAMAQLSEILYMYGIKLAEGTMVELLKRSDFLNNPDVSYLTLKNYAEQIAAVGETEENVQRIVPDERDGRKFNLGRMIAERDIVAVNAELSRIKEPALALLGLLFWEVRPDYLNKIGIPYSESKGKPGAFKEYTKEKLLRAMEIITREEMAIKNGAYSEQIALRKCVMDLIAL